MTTEKPSLASAYGLSSPQDNLALYRDWAATYDSSFAADMDYLMPGHVAAAYVQAGGTGPVLDVGAGTGLVAAELARLETGPVDGTDFSAEMLEVARRKGLYRHLFRGDVTARLEVADGVYAGVVSAGTFTLGHVGPEGLAELVRVTASGGLIVLSVHERHFAGADFAGAFDQLAGRIAILQRDSLPIYGPAATGDHASDRGWVVRLRRV